MQIGIERRPDEVLIRADGRPVGSLDREFFEAWSERIDDAPEACLERCLRSGDGPLDAEPAR